MDCTQSYHQYHGCQYGRFGSMVHILNGFFKIVEITIIVFLCNITTIIPQRLIAYCDAAKPWQLGFQDATTPMMQGIIECVRLIVQYGTSILATSSTTMNAPVTMSSICSSNIGGGPVSHQFLGMHIQPFVDVTVI